MLQNEVEIWRPGKRILFRLLLPFVLLFIISFSFPHEFLPDIGFYTHPFFERISSWFGHSVLGLQKDYTSALVSDSTGFYIHTLLLFLVSCLACLAWTLMDRKTKSYPGLQYAFTTLVCYYLAVQLLAYGTNKIFKWQFFLPEPNTLFTTIGNTSHDLLFWSTIGLSRTYSIFTGSLEVIAALLLFFRRTRMAGSVLAFAVILHVLVINFSFDISVKLYSLFLLLLCGIAIAPYARKMYVFFFSTGWQTVQIDQPYRGVAWKYRKWIRASIIIFLLADALALYVKTGNYNDDEQRRPFLHGAYDVKLFVHNGDTLAPLLTDTIRWKRMFIHRRGYLISEFMNDSMQDYELEYDTVQHYLWINLPGDPVQTNIQYALLPHDMLQLDAVLHDRELHMILKKINLSDLPALQRSFNWTID